MASFGEIRRRLISAFPATPLTLLDDLINERYADILDRIPWQRLRVQAVLQTTAPYETGTVAATGGLSTLTLTAGTWTSAMSGRSIRLAARNEYYEFTFTSATTGTLDRAYEGATGAALAYKIWQSVYTLPANLRVLDGLRSPRGTWDLEKVSLSELNHMAAARLTFGIPRYFAPFMDDASDPPLGQVEIYPIPDTVEGLPMIYTADAYVFDPAVTSATQLPWVRSGAIVAGVESDILRLVVKDLAGAAAAEALFEKRIAQMLVSEASRRTPGVIRMPDRFTRHRRARWQR